MIFKAPFLISLLFLILSVIDLHDCKEVVHLTKDTLSKLNETGFTLVMFHTGWCGHCKTLTPKFQEAAVILDGSGYKLHSVNCEDEKELCQSFQIAGYPTLKAFHNGNYVKDYPDRLPREVEAIVDFVKKENLPSFSLIDSDEQLAAILSNKAEYSVIAIISDDHPRKLAAIEKFAAVARDNRHLASFSITHLSKSDLLKPYSEASLLIVSQETTPVNVDILEGDILTHVHRSKLPLYGKLDESTYESYSAAKRPIGFLFATSEEGPSYAEMMTDIAKRFSDLVSLVWIDSALYGSHAATLGLSGKKFPCFAVHDMESGLKFPLSEDLPLDSAQISKFVDEVITGKISPYYKSESIPVHDESTHVQKLVFDNLNTVLNSSKAVLIKFFAPWCRACTRLAPNYSDLAGSFKDQAYKIVFAEYDLENNDLPLEIESSIRMIPALYLYLPHTKSFSEFVKFEGEPFKTKIAEFLLASCTHGLEPVTVDSDDHISQDYEGHDADFGHDADSGFGSDSQDFEDINHDDL